MNEHKYLDYLGQLSYSALQHKVKAINLPSNVKKYHLITMLHKKRYSTRQDFESYVDDVKLEKALQSKENKKRRSSSQSSKTSSQSTPKASRPSQRVRAKDCTAKAQCVANAQCVQIQEVEKPKSVAASDRVLRSFKNVDYLQMENAVHEILRSSSQVSVVKRKLRVTQLHVSQHNVCDHKSPEKRSSNKQLMRVTQASRSLLRPPALLDLTTTTSESAKAPPRYDMTNLRHILNSYMPSKFPVFGPTSEMPSKSIQICVPPQRAVTVSAISPPQSETPSRPRYRVACVEVRQHDGQLDTLKALVSGRASSPPRRKVYYLMDRPHKYTNIKPQPGTSILQSSNQSPKVNKNIELKRDHLNDSHWQSSNNITLKDLLDAADVRHSAVTEVDDLKMKYPNLSASMEDVTVSVSTQMIKTQRSKGLDKDYLDSLSTKPRTYPPPMKKRKKQEETKKTKEIKKKEGVVYQGTFKISTIDAKDIAAYNYQSNTNNNLYWNENKGNNNETESNNYMDYSTHQQSDAGTPTSESLPKIYTAFSRFQDMLNQDAITPLQVQVTNEAEIDVSSHTKSSDNKDTSVEVKCEYNGQSLAKTSLLQVATSAHTDTGSTHTVTTADVKEPSLPYHEDTSLCRDEAQLYANSLPPALSASSTDVQRGIAANVTLDEMFEDAMEIISQDGNYMERLAMDAWCRCVFCACVGPSRYMENHVRKEHTGLILHRDSSSWSVRHALDHVVSGHGGCSSAVQYRDVLYLLHTCCDDDCDTLFITIYRLSSSCRVHASLTVQSSVTGEYLSWKGEVCRYPFHAPTYLSLCVSKHLLPRSDTNALGVRRDLNLTIYIRMFS